jgi:hypothetical protein
LALGAYRTRDTRRLVASDAGGRPADDLIRLGPLKIPLPPPATAPSDRGLAQFGPAIELESATLSAPTASGQATRVALIWRATAQPDRDLTVFVHAVDATGKVVAQDDRQPVDRTYPTSIWDAGERVLDRHEIALPAGRYRLRAGLYDATSLQRVARTDAPGDFIDLGEVEVR